MVTIRIPNDFKELSRLLIAKKIETNKADAVRPYRGDQGARVFQSIMKVVQ
jgi:hypothetical protein